MIVVDASAAVLGLLNDGDARRHLEADEMHFPHLIDSEITHVLRRQELQRRLSSAQASRALAVWRRLGARRHPVVGLLTRVWALRHNLSAYDATYVALAEVLGCPLLSADARLAAAPGSTAPVVLVQT